MISRLLLSLLSLFAVNGCASFSGPTRVQRGIVVKEIPGAEPIEGDFYFPKTPGPHPALIVVHGGGWVARSGRMEDICKKLARHGYVAFNATYRLAPETHYPDSVDDIRAAIRFVRAHAAEYGVDPERIGGWGYSAGANMLLLAALDGQMGLNALVSGGTPADLTQWPNFPLAEEFIGTTYKDRPDLWRAASPVNHVTAQTPPVFLYHGGLDDFVEVEQMHRLERALQAQHRPYRSHIEGWLGHFSTYIFGWESEREALEFLGEIDSPRTTSSEPTSLVHEKFLPLKRVLGGYLN